MSAAQFEHRMKELLRRDPFEPFVVQTDREEVLIENPRAVALAAGGAGYIGPERIHFIESSNVVEIRSLRA